VAQGRITQPGKPRVVHPCSIGSIHQPEPKSDGTITKLFPTQTKHSAPNNKITFHFSFAYSFRFIYTAYLNEITWYTVSVKTSSSHFVVQRRKRETPAPQLGNYSKFTVNERSFSGGGGTLNDTTHYGITLAFIKFSIQPKRIVKSSTIHTSY